MSILADIEHVLEERASQLAEERVAALKKKVQWAAKEFTERVNDAEPLIQMVEQLRPSIAERARSDVALNAATSLSELTQ